MGEDRVRLALIGCGAHAESAHARPLAHFAGRNPGFVRLAAACDIDSERAGRFCREYGFAAAYSDVEAMLNAEKLDAVISVLPIEKIAEVGSTLLRSGIPCVLEKPPGRSLEEVNALAELARKTCAPHMVSMNRRFSPYLNRAVAWTKGIGSLRYVRGQMLRHARREDDFLWGTGVHIVDAVRYIGGEIAAYEVHCLEDGPQPTPWHLITLRFASGCTGCIEIFPTTGAVSEKFELYGEGFRAEARTMGPPGESVRCWKEGALVVEEAADPGAPLFLRDGSYEETSSFLYALRDRKPLRPTLDDVLPSLELCGRR